MQKTKADMINQRNAMCDSVLVSRHFNCFPSGHILYCYKITFFLLFNSNLIYSSNILFGDTYYFSQYQPLRLHWCCLWCLTYQAPYQAPLTTIKHQHTAIFYISVYSWWSSTLKLRETNNCTLNCNKPKQNGQYKHIRNIKEKVVFFSGGILGHSYLLVNK